MVFLGAVGTGLAYTVLATLVGRTDATRGTIGVFLTPIVATLLGVTLRHEELPAAALVGALLILGGAILTSRPEPPLSKGASPPRPVE
jgi:drug/metabolite transporter (DMT)-like permease